MERAPLPAFNRRTFLKGVAAAGGAAVLATGCTPNTPPEGLPHTLRSATEGIVATWGRRIAARFSKPAILPSLLEQRLGNSLAASSNTGMINGHILEETETTDIPNIVFPFNPWHYTFDNGRQIVPIFANTPDFAAFREDHPEALTRVFDRTVWAISRGLRVTAVVETDKGLGGFPDGLGVLLDYGVRSFIMGNELNVPNAPEGATGQSVWLANGLRKLADSRGIKVEISFPGLAFFGEGEYLEEVTRYCQDTSQPFPFERVPDHFYGPAEVLLSRIRMLRRKMASCGLDGVPYDLGEGATLPAAANGVSERQVAEGYVVQIVSQAAASEDVGRFYCYSAFDWGKQEHSLMRAEDGKLIPKDSFRAYNVVAKLFGGLKASTTIKDRDYTQVMGQRKDGIKFSVVWAKDRDYQFRTDSEEDAVFNALGEPVQIQGRKIDLPKREVDEVEGSAMIILHAA